MRNEAGAREIGRASPPASRGLIFIAASLGLLYAVIALFENYV